MVRVGTAEEPRVVRRWSFLRPKFPGRAVPLLLPRIRWYVSVVSGRRALVSDVGPRTRVFAKSAAGKHKP